MKHAALITNLRVAVFAHKWKFAMSKQCQKCEKPTLPILGVVFASTLNSTVRCRVCGELWVVMPSSVWRNIAMTWGVITGSVSPFIALLLWSWWPILLSLAILLLLAYKAAEAGSIKKRFSLS